MTPDELVNLVNNKIKTVPIVKGLDDFIKEQINNEAYRDKIVHLEVYEKSAVIEFDENPDKIVYVHCKKIKEELYLNGGVCLRN